MYEEHWKLTQKPFDNHADKAWHYPSETHQGAMLKLRYTVENRRGAAVLAGPPGVGKTWVVHQLLTLLPLDFQPAIHVVFPQMSADQLLGFIVQELVGGELSSATELNVRRLQQFLAQNTADNAHALVAIDEAHLLRDQQTIEMLRLLMNFQSDGQPDLTLLLVGQSQLLSNLDRLPSLTERMAVRCVLSPFSVVETASYISHRLTQAGAEQLIFTDEAVQTIHQLTFGIPRRINQICDLALLIGYAEDKSRLEAADIESVSRELVEAT